MKDEGSLIEPGTLVFQRMLPGPIERVWEYLTDPDKRGLWLAAGEMEQRVGGHVELVFHNNELSPGIEPPEKYRDVGGRVSFTGHVTRWEPPRVLAYTWAESDGSDSEVTFELDAQGDSVRLLLTHRRLDEKRAVLLSVSAGWHTHLDILVDRLNERTPRPFWQEHTRLEAEYAQRMPVNLK